MQNSRRASVALVAVSAKERGGLQTLSGLKLVPEVKGIKSACYASLLIRRLLDSDSPVSRPCEGAKPDSAALFLRLAPIDHEPRIDVVTGIAAAALENLHPRVDRLARDLILGRPAPRYVCELVTVPGREIPGPGLSAFEH